MLFCCNYVTDYKVNMLLIATGQALLMLVHL